MPHQKTLCAGSAGRQLWDELFREATQSAQYTQGPCLAGTPPHRARVRLWQALAVLSAFVGPADAEGVCKAILPLLGVSPVLECGCKPGRMQLSQCSQGVAVHLPGCCTWSCALQDPACGLEA